MRNFFKPLGALFSFRQVERYGLVLLIAVLLGFSGWRYFRHSHRRPVAAVAPETVAATTDTVSYRSTGTSVPRRDTLFRFDPNTATKDELVSLGFSPKQAQVILNYRAKGGRFRDADDFRRCYVLSDTMYRRLRPWVAIPAVGAGTAASTAQNTAPDKVQVDTLGHEVKADPLFMFDPNTVSVEQLQLLGFSSKQAAVIDNYRKAGAVFRRPDDFKRSYVVNDYMFNRLRPYIAIDTALLTGK